MSMPIHWRPSACAATSAVPQPQNGSRTMSPGLEGNRDHPFQERQRLLRGPWEPFLGLAVDGGNVVPDVLERRPWVVVEVPLVLRHPRLRVHESALALELLHVGLRVRPIAPRIGPHCDSAQTGPLVRGGLPQSQTRPNCGINLGHDIVVQMAPHAGAGGDPSIAVDRPQVTAFDHRVLSTGPKVASRSSLSGSPTCGRSCSWSRPLLTAVTAVFITASPGRWC